METLRPDSWEYVLTIPYKTDEELDAIIDDDILREACDIAESWNSFIETDSHSLEHPERSW
jgi:hypothetical protein